MVLKYVHVLQGIKCAATTIHCNTGKENCVLFTIVGIEVRNFCLFLTGENSGINSMLI